MSKQHVSSVCPDEEAEIAGGTSQIQAEKAELVVESARKKGRCACSGGSGMESSPGP